MLGGRRVLLGVTGSIAAYKTPQLVRELTRAGAEVRVVMTPAAAEFVSPLALATVSRAEVVRDMFPAEPSQGTWHIDLGMWAEVMLIAPASAGTIAKLAHGFADNALTALVLALRAPLVVAPAMDTDMYSHQATQENLDILRRRGVVIVPPDEGDLASGLVGPGRLPDPPVLIEVLEDVVWPGRRDLTGTGVLVTAGPTHEALDPVRFLGNHSSGKMGFAIAAAAARRGADVTLVAGPVHLATPRGVRRVDVTTAQEMRDAVMGNMDGVRVAVLAAAVADFRPATVSAHKIKKEGLGDEGLTLVLERNPDILAELGARDRGGVLVGFALETDDAVRNAREKLERKRADMIVLNNPLEQGAAFGGDTNVATFLFADGSTEELGLMPKSDLAHALLDRAVYLLSSRSGA